jgi:flagellar biosynthesis chaperone FliJ
MNSEYFKEKLIELQNTSENKYKNISEILTKCTEYEDNLEIKLKESIQEINNIKKTQEQINQLFDSICLELMK